MPRVYRLIKERFLDTPLAGGSAKRGERWNPVGVDVLYTSSSPELALVEVLANLMPIRLDELPTYYLITIHLPDEQALKVYRVISYRLTGTHRCERRSYKPFWASG